jgi:5-methylcytosine-specific restriction endonuclease McrA
VDKKVVELVHARANGYCEKCGWPALENMALHHRKLKSRGGKDTPANLIFVHHGCHNLKTDSIHLSPGYATEKGWIVPSWEEPTNFPMVKPDGTIVLLKDDGTEAVMMEGD